jgi:hypothetical protein
MLKVMTELEPIGSDRVHPNQRGYHIMAQIFLYSLGFIEEKNYKDAFVFDEWNAKRREIEVQLKKLDYIDYNKLFEKSRELGWDTYEKIEACKNILANPDEKRAFLRDCAEFYIGNAYKRNELTDELVRLTVYPRSCKR